MTRSILLTIFLLFSLPLFMNNANAAGSDDARHFTDDVGKKVLAIVNSSAEAGQKQQQLQQLFSENVDMDWMGRFVMGRTWSQATQEQQGRYLQAYRSYVLMRYTTNLAEYTDSNYTITGVKNEADGQYIVGMEVKTPHAEQQELQAGYRIHAGENGQLKIIDIIVEGVSLLTTERSEFSSTIQKDGIDKFIEELASKSQKSS